MSSRVRIALAVLFVISMSPRVLGAERSEASFLVVHAGKYLRQDTPVHVDLPSGALGDAVAKDLADSPRGIWLREIRDGQPVGDPIVGQIERSGGAGRIRVTWVVSGETPASASRRFRVESGAGSDSFPSPWSFSDPKTGSLDLKHGSQDVLRYNLTPVTSARYGPIQHRDGYIHPAFTPSGALITGDYSSYHPHHRGFFLAYAKTEVGSVHPDFWNIHTGTGKIHHERLKGAWAGPVTARWVADHRWDAKDAGTVLRERWDVEVYDIPHSPYWLFDLTSTQEATDKPVVLTLHRYGGMAYRGPDSFIKLGNPGILDVLTSAGLHDRKSADQKPARWFDLTGPVAAGSTQYGGALLMDSPTNPHFPNVVRVHPVTLPFCCYVPAHDAPLTIEKDKPVVFRYRVMIHDGHPDGRLDERLWHDFSEPPEVTLEREAG
jgi:hypothetical protein